MSGQNLPNQGEPIVPVAPEPQPAPAPVEPQANPRSQDQWEKLLESNRQLNDQLRQALEVKQQPPQRQPAQPTYPQQPQVQDFVEYDPATGEKFINEQRLAQRMAELEAKANKADAVDQKLQQYLQSNQTQQAERETSEVIREYPELDTNGDKFDKNFYAQVRAVITDSMMAPQDYDEMSKGLGRLTATQAAKRVRSMYPAVQTPVAPPVDPTQDAANQAKADAVASVSNTPQQLYTTQGDADLENLRVKTRYGDDESLAMRLMHTEHILPAYGYGTKK
jgi:hypothetical protein